MWADNSVLFLEGVFAYFEKKLVPPSIIYDMAHIKWAI